MPTIIEGGLPGYDADSWAGCVAPAGVPRDIAARLSVEIAKWGKVVKSANIPAD